MATPYDSRRPPRMIEAGAPPEGSSDGGRMLWAAKQPRGVGVGASRPSGHLDRAARRVLVTPCCEILTGDHRDGERHEVLDELRGADTRGVGSPETAALDVETTDHRRRHHH